MEQRTKQTGRVHAKVRSQDERPHILEWVIGAASALLVVAMIGFVLYQAFTATSAHPELHVVAETIEPAGDGFHVIFRAANRGGATAAGVEVEGRIERGGETLETGRVTLDYVPAHSRQKGGLLFSEDPRQGRLVLEAVGYSEP